MVVALFQGDWSLGKFSDCHHWPAMEPIRWVQQQQQAVSKAVFSKWLFDGFLVLRCFKSSHSSPQPPFGFSSKTTHSKTKSLGAKYQMSEYQLYFRNTCHDFSCWTIRKYLHFQPKCVRVQGAPAVLFDRSVPQRHRPVASTKNMVFWAKLMSKFFADQTCCLKPTSDLFHLDLHLSGKGVHW